MRYFAREDFTITYRGGDGQSAIIVTPGYENLNTPLSNALDFLIGYMEEELI